MNTIDELFKRLKDRQQTFALTALRAPQTRDAFEYGYRVGVVTGYEEAINTLLQLLKEEKDSDPDL